jgi:protein gp37
MRWAKSEDPRVWRRPATVFVGALGDLFGMAYGEIHAVLRTVAQCDWHRFLLLTKRPERAASWIRENHNDCWAHHLPWPFAHVYLGVSVEDQATADARVTALAALPACHRWVSAEPLLGPIAMGVPWMRAVEWVVAGGENGPGARPCDPDWLRSLRDQCAARSIAFYLKGLGKGDKEGVLDGRTHREFPPGLRKPVEVPA